MLRSRQIAGHAPSCRRRKRRLSLPSRFNSLKLSKVASMPSLRSASHTSSPANPQRDRRFLLAKGQAAEATVKTFWNIAGVCKAVDSAVRFVRKSDGWDQIPLVVGSCTSHPGVLSSIPKREEQTGAPCVKVPGSSRVPQCPRLWHSSTPSAHSFSHSPSAPPPSFTQSSYPPRSLVRDERTHPHRPRLVVSHSTCPPLSSSPPRTTL